jgi:hypothetical protein
MTQRAQTVLPARASNRLIEMALKLAARIAPSDTHRASLELLGGAYAKLIAVTAQNASPAEVAEMIRVGQDGLARAVPVYVSAIRQGKGLG